MTPGEPADRRSEDEATRRILAAEARWRAQRDVEQASLLRAAFLLVLVVAVVLAVILR